MRGHRLTSVRKVKRRLAHFAGKYDRGVAYAQGRLGSTERMQMAKLIRAKRAEGKRV